MPGVYSSALPALATGVRHYTYIAEEINTLEPQGSRLNLSIYSIRLVFQPLPRAGRGVYRVVGCYLRYKLIIQGRQNTVPVGGMWGAGIDLGDGFCFVLDFRGGWGVLLEIWIDGGFELG